MREAIGGTWLFGLVLTFIVFFASFLAVSINYSKAFHVKNNIVDLIGKYEGNNCNSRKKIGEYLYDVGYLVNGRCDPGYSAYNTNGEWLGTSTEVDKIKGYFCIKDEDNSASAVVEKKYYRVVTFFKLDLPLVEDFTTFKIKGETEAIFFASHDHDDNTCI